MAGLHYALANGARVVNMSLNGADRSLALEEAIAAAEAQGVLVVASAGNDGGDRDSVPSYPASIASSAIVSVASSNRGGRLAYASAYGASSVDIAAPGDNILTTDLRRPLWHTLRNLLRGGLRLGRRGAARVGPAGGIGLTAARRAAGVCPARRSSRRACARRAAQRGRRRRSGSRSRARR